MYLTKLRECTKPRMNLNLNYICRGIMIYMSNERVTCVVLTGCGLSLEGVAGVDQEGPPGERDAKAGFEEITELFK